MKFFAVLFFILLLVACAAQFPPNGDYPKDNNPVFPGTDLIVSGLPASGAVSNATPQFTWTSTGEPLVYLGIFERSIDISAGKIVNINDNIWAWHTGLATGREGDVLYGEGFNVIGGKLDTSHPPVALTAGNTYYWALWTWNPRGTAITYSSRENYFTVVP